MAQWKSGPYDVVFHLKLETSLRLLRTAADGWALRGQDAWAVDDVLAVLIRVFAASWSQYSFRRDRVEQVRTLMEWLLYPIESPQGECGRLQPHADANQITAAVVELHGTLADAMQHWVGGNPEQPRTEDVLRRLAMIFFQHRLVHRPPPADLDKW